MREFSDWSDAEFLTFRQECLDNFEDENGEENVIEYAECVPDLVDEILRLRKLLQNDYNVAIEKYPKVGE